MSQIGIRSCFKDLKLYQGHKSFFYWKSCRGRTLNGNSWPTCNNIEFEFELWAHVQFQRARQISQHNCQRNWINESKTTPGSQTLGIKWVWNQKSNACGDEVPNKILRKVPGVAALFPCLSVNIYLIINNKLIIWFLLIKKKKGLKSKEKNIGVKRKQKSSTQTEAREGRKKKYTQLNRAKWKRLRGQK